MGKEVIEMEMLVLDTSGPVCGVAVMAEDQVLAEMTAHNGNTHSVNLMPMVDEALHAAGRTLADMDVIAAVAGPGSFTGVRIGVATAKGLAHGSGKPCVPVDALEALSRGAGSWDGLVCPLQDARAGQVYGAAFLRGERKMADAPMKLEDFLERAQELAAGEAKPLLFTGDGAAAHRERIEALLGERARFAEGPFAFLRPAVAGLVALEAIRNAGPDPAGVLLDYRSLRETYLRPPHAEKNKKLLEAMGREG